MDECEFDQIFFLHFSSSYVFGIHVPGRWKAILIIFILCSFFLDKLATVLSDELTQAFDFFQSGRGDSDDDGDDNYSFKKDFFQWL